MTKTFLALNAVAWLPYGVYLLLKPDALVEIAGVAATTTTGTVEIRAMYGGVQAAVGVLALIALAQASYRRPALATIACVALGLFTGRMLGVVLDGDTSSYTIGALIFELPLGLVALNLLRTDPELS